MVRQMPSYIGDYDVLLDDVSRQINAETKSFLRSNNTNITLQITRKGRVTISSSNSKLLQLYKLLEYELNKLKWIPGKQGNNYVNVQSVFPVRIINDKLNIPIDYKNVRGKLVKCIITDEKSKAPISNVRLITKHNKCSYYSNQNGEVIFYCEDNDEIEISHISYLSLSFNAPENKKTLKVGLKGVVYELETVDLTEYSPKKLPFKKSLCNFEDWQEKKQNHFMILGIGDHYAAKMAVFNGGYECLYNFIAEKFELPKSAFENEYTDAVDISFTITEVGELKDVTFSKHLNYGIDDSLNKLFIEMPKWKPASQSRITTEQRFVIKLIIGSNKYWKKTMANKS